MRLVLGTRGSHLALAQSREVARVFTEKWPACAIIERIIRTTGDERLDVSLSAPGALDKGLFTKELERALLDGEIDIAVHSLKDLPTTHPDGLTLGAILAREDPADVLISTCGGGIDELPQHAVVATGSLRRRNFLLWKRPDLRVVDIRGNVPTRLEKLRASSDMDALVLAEAGLRRLEAADNLPSMAGLTRTHLDFMLPAPGQGAVAVQCRSGDVRTLNMLAGIQDTETKIAVDAERAVLAGLGGGCHLPLGARGQVIGGAFQLDAVWFPDGPKNPRVASAREDIGAVSHVVTAVLKQLNEE